MNAGYTVPRTDPPRTTPVRLLDRRLRGMENDTLGKPRQPSLRTAAAWGLPVLVSESAMVSNEAATRIEDDVRISPGVFFYHR